MSLVSWCPASIVYFLDNHLRTSGHSWVILFLFYEYWFYCTPRDVQWTGYVLYLFSVFCHNAPVAPEVVPCRALFIVQSTETSITLCHLQGQILCVLKEQRQVLVLYLHMAINFSHFGNDIRSLFTTLPSRNSKSVNQSLQNNSIAESFLLANISRRPSIFQTAYPM